jgi:ABC-type multidrug transport system ATPase subunit
MGGLAKVLAVLGTLFIFVLLGRRRYKRSWERDISAWRSQVKTAEPDDEQEAEIDMLQEAEEQKLLLPSRDVLHRIDIELDNIGVRLAGRWALTGVTGRLSAGRVTAIMGPSGAGKSVLLHTLAGRQVGGSAKLSGTIRLNGSDCVSLADCRTVVGFVPQEDVMHRSLTVFENVDFNAQWRLPRIMTRRQKTDVVFAALDVLGLDNPRVMRTRIGDDTERGVSGGERKRVNIGMELVAQPSLLLLDEPTSGLDASTSIDVVRALKSVAESGVNVVVALHQPRVETLRLFDDLLLLAPGGRTVYAGPTQNAVAYFTGLGYALPDHCNPGTATTLISIVHVSLLTVNVAADYFLDAISGLLPRNNGDGSLAAAAGSKTDHATYLVEQWEAQRAVAGSHQDDRLRRQGSCNLVDLQCLDRKTAGVLAQTWLCTKRAVIQRTRELNTALTDYCLVATAGLVLGLLFHAVQLQKVDTHTHHTTHTTAHTHCMSRVMTRVQTGAPRQPVHQPGARLRSHATGSSAVWRRARSVRPRG